MEKEPGVTDPDVQRRLVAVLIADIAGYTRLMGEDEDATMAAWWSYRREITDPKIENYHGRIVKHTGDGFLAEFLSVVDAAKCALEIQTEIAERNKGVPAEKCVELRIGLTFAMWLPTTRTSTAMALTSRPASRRWPIQGGSALRPRSTANSKKDPGGIRGSGRHKVETPRSTGARAPCPAPEWFRRARKHGQACSWPSNRNISRLPMDGGGVGGGACGYRHYGMELRGQVGGERVIIQP
jgi:hypothetical protein